MRTRKSKRRLSFGASPVKKTLRVVSNANPKSIYEVLLAVIFALTHNSERHAQAAFDILASFTPSQTRKLDEDSVVMLEEVFNILYTKLVHIFLPFIHNVDIRDSAEQYLDIAHIVPIVESAVHMHVNLSKCKIRELMEPLEYLHTVLERTMRCCETPRWESCSAACHRGTSMTPRGERGSPMKIHRPCGTSYR